MQALDFVPRLLLTSTDLIRKTRNEFAHNLDRTTLDSLPGSLQQALRGVRAEIYGRFGADNRKPKESLRAEFKALAFFAIAGLDTYAGNLALLRQRLAEPRFMQEFRTRVAAENEAVIEAILKGAPESVEDREGVRIERYSDGIVNIASPKQA